MSIRTIGLIRLVTIILLASRACDPLPLCATQEPASDAYLERRIKMVEVAVANAGVRNERVLDAMRKTKRHEFVPEHLREMAYVDGSLPIGEQQTISSPFIVACMTEAIDPQPVDRVLEIGTGSGYQAAVLSPLVAEVYTIEIVEPLGKSAEKVLNRLGYTNVHVLVGDGYQGWPEHAPFNKIIVTCSPEDVPRPLVDQLAEGGLMVIPIGQRHQQSLVLLKKTGGELVEEKLLPTWFVPMTGRAEDEREVKPDGSRPAVVNGDFEAGLDEKGFAPGWYYERQWEFVEADEATGTSRHVRLATAVAGQNAHLMQGLAIDGRLAPRVEFKASAKWDDVKPGAGESDVATVALTFYDAQRREIGTEFFGPFTGSREHWKQFSRKIRVPIAAREAIVRIGVFGTSGTLSVDNVTLKVIE